MSRPHAAAIIEDTVHEQIERVLRSRGWGNRVITHVGYGSSSFVRVYARILLGRKGWQQVVVEVQGTDPVAADVFIVADGVTHGIVSDIDDTVITTMLPRPMIAAFNTFVRRGKARHAVSGMAPMYRRILSAHPGAPIVYVSTGAWNAAATLNRFLVENGFPLGPLMLTDWGPTNTGWFRSGQAHKRTCLDRLARDFPEITWLLVGDDGQ